MDFAPHFVTGMDHASGYHICPNGRIEAAWRRTGEKMIELTLAVPEGLLGNLMLEEGWTEADSGLSVLAAESGTYHLKQS